MSKRIIAKALKDSAKDEFTKLPIDDVLLTKEKFSNNEESKIIINKLVEQYYETFFTKAVSKKIAFVKTKVIWPADENIKFSPYISSIESYRYGNKYVLLIIVLNLLE